jgi:hypothetical protein
MQYEQTPMKQAVKHFIKYLEPQLYLIGSCLIAILIIADYLSN